MKSKLPNIPAHIVRGFKDLGYSKCVGAFYSTKPNDVLLNLVSNSVANILGDEAAHSLVDFRQKNMVMYPEMQLNFVGGRLSLLNRETTRPMKGSYLLLAKPVESDNREAAQKALADIKTCAAIISLMHGELVAAERHFSGVFDLNITRIVATGDPVYVRQTTDQDGINQEMAKILNKIEAVEFLEKPNVLALVRRAHHELDSSIKFMFMWLALEAAIGDGKARRHFALVTMGSNILDRTINSLRDKRSALVHDGILVGMDYKEYLQIKCVIVMAIVKREDIRRSLLRYLERSLLTDDDKAL